MGYTSCEIALEASTPSLARAAYRERQSTPGPLAAAPKGALWTAQASSLRQPHVALTTFDGAGNFSATYTDVSPGRPGGYSAPVRGTITGTYTVNSDCTGSMSSPSFGLTWDLVIIGGGTEVLGIATTPFIVATSDFKKL